jgi:CubicO group peptidase (beta-lactamase class C family)
MPERARFDFASVRTAMQRYVDAEILAGVSYAVLHGRDLVALDCVGWADREQRIELRADHIFRVFSNTKLVTSCAVLMLFEEGRFALDDPIERYIPQLANRRVLRPGATTLDDTVPANGPITIRHLLTHTSGLGYGLFDPGTPLYKAYDERNVRNPESPLSEMIEALADLPLLFHPGTAWEYSVATDVLGRLVEIIADQRFDTFIQARILDRLGMHDTAFMVPAARRDRLTAYYRGVDRTDPMKPGLIRIDDAPYPEAYLRPFARLSGGGGLVSTLPDMVALVRSLLPGGATLLAPETIRAMMTNQLRDGLCVQFPHTGPRPGSGFGLAGGVCVQPGPVDPPDATGEVQWGGIAGTQWWISPRTNVAAVLMTQRLFANGHPFAIEFRQRVYRACSPG